MIHDSQVARIGFTARKPSTSVKIHWRSAFVFLNVCIPVDTDDTLQKEPKLSRARQIPEWEEYDAEVARFARKLADQGIIRSAAYASDVDALANSGSTASSGEERSVDESEDIIDPVEEEEPPDSKTRDEL